MLSPGYSFLSPGSGVRWPRGLRACGWWAEAEVREGGRQQRKTWERAKRGVLAINPTPRALEHPPFSARPVVPPGRRVPPPGSAGATLPAGSGQMGIPCVPGRGALPAEVEGTRAVGSFGARASVAAWAVGPWTPAHLPLVVQVPLFPPLP